MSRYIFTILLTVAALSVKGQELVNRLTGSIADQETMEKLPGISILIKGSNTGAITDSQGQFEITSSQPLPWTVHLSSVGYASMDITVDHLQPLSILLISEAILGQEVVITASKMEEHILKSSVAIEMLDLKAIRNSAAPSFYDALENLKGVQMTTSSLTFKVPNTRGFNSPNNFRFTQLVDGVDMQAATLGVPLGNAIGPTELDIERMEITPGAASALYGMNAINGLANLMTRSPFTHQGLSIYQKVGVNHIDGRDHQAAALTETAIRYAKVIRDRFAFKINASYLRGTDWIANNGRDQNPNELVTANPNFPSLSTAIHPAYDAWNRYGDEANNNSPVSIQYLGKTQTFNVRRTGYWEKDLYDPTVKNIKLDAGIYYKLPGSLTLSYQYRFGLMNGLFQRGNKIKLEDVSIQNHRIALQGNGLTFRAYTTLENTGKSYNLKPLSDNLDLNNGSNTEWALRFQQAAQQNLDQGLDLAMAFSYARTFADEGRAQPGTEAFNVLKQTIANINNWDIAANVPGAPITGGAALWQRSRTYHADIQYNFLEKIKFMDLLVGADYRMYEVIPDGNNFVDFTRPIADRTKQMEDGSFGRNIYYTKFGAFASATKLLLQDRLKINASARLDHNPDFSPKFNPRLALVYTASERHNFRASIQNGYRYPALFEALSYVNNGNVRRVGGLAKVNEGLGYNENSYTQTSINQFVALVNQEMAQGTDKNTAALKNRGTLVVANLGDSRPERIVSLEIGYRSVLLNNKLVIDWDAYSNAYSDFLGQVEVSVPTNETVGSDAAVLSMLSRSQQTRYRVYTNAKNTYNSYGSSLGVQYSLPKKYLITGNINYNNIHKNAEPDVFVTGFNTPKLVSNLSFSNPSVYKNLGFNLVYRWQEAFLWQSPLANGTVPAIHNIDGQVSLSIPRQHIRVKMGGTNLFNKRYYQYAAGPTIGGLYYASVTWEGIL